MATSAVPAANTRLPLPSSGALSLTAPPPSTGGILRPGIVGIGSGRGTASATRTARSGRTAIQVLGEEMFQQLGLPAEAREMELNAALNLGKRRIVQEQLGIPKEATKDMAAEEMLDVVGQLELFDSRDQVANPKFWEDTTTKGFDSALGPIIKDKLGVPKDIRPGSPASKILEDAGELQNLGLDFGEPGNWQLLDDFQQGKIGKNQFDDLVNKSKDGKGTGTGNSRTGSPAGTNPGDSGTGRGNTGGNTNTPPSGSDATNLPGPGGAATPPGSDQQSSEKKNDSSGTSGTSPADSQQQHNAGNLEGDEIQAVDPVTYTAVVTHNADGSFTVTIYENDGAGNSTEVGTETYTDTEGDGTYEGDKGGSSEGKPANGSSSTSSDKQEYNFDDSDSDSSSSESDSDSSDTSSGDDTKSSKPDDEYTPDPSSGLVGNPYAKTEWMAELYRSLSNEKSSAGKGGTDSTPNPTNETYGGGKYPVDYESMITLPADPFSTQSGKLPASAVDDLQNPLKNQGGVIDPPKRDE